MGLLPKSLPPPEHLTFDELEAIARSRAPSQKAEGVTHACEPLPHAGKWYCTTHGEGALGKDNLTERDLRQMIDNRDYLIAEYQKLLEVVRLENSELREGAKNLMRAFHDGADLDKDKVVQAALKLGIFASGLPPIPKQQGENHG